jgi:hypothetical protein
MGHFPAAVVWHALLLTMLGASGTALGGLVIVASPSQPSTVALGLIQVRQQRSLCGRGERTPSTPGSSLSPSRGASLPEGFRVSVFPTQQGADGATEQIARGWARPPCRHCKTQSC